MSIFFTNFDSLFVNIQGATVCTLEKVNLKFKPLYLLNYVGYVNEICTVSRLNPPLQTRSSCLLTRVLANIVPVTCFSFCTALRKH